MNDELLVVATTSGEDEARLVAAVLEAAEIPTLIEGGALYDEWAVTQRAMGQLANTVKVPASRLADARRALEEARGRGALLRAAGAVEVEPTDEALTPGDEESARLAQKPTYNLWAILAAVAATAVFVWVMLYCFGLLP